MNITLKEASEEFLNKLKTEEKSERTVYTYGKDLEQIMAFFGENKEINKILIPHAGKFLKSDELLKKKDKENNLIDRAKPTIDKTIRVFRMLMLWAKEQEYIQNLPLSKAFLSKTKEEA